MGVSSKRKIRKQKFGRKKETDCGKHVACELTVTKKIILRCLHVTLEVLLMSEFTDLHKLHDIILKYYTVEVEISIKRSCLISNTILLIRPDKTKHCATVILFIRYAYHYLPKAQSNILREKFSKSANVP